jgi:hypothetical protein
MDASTTNPETLDVEVDVGQAPGLGLVAATELQDHLLVATNDLDRLQALLTDACDTLLRRFTRTLAELGQQYESATDPRIHAAFGRLRDELGGAVTALQFQDMATQLITHTTLRLRGCADAVARELFVDDADGTIAAIAPPAGPNPVTQSEMDAGSIELF